MAATDPVITTRRIVCRDISNIVDIASPHDKVFVIYNRRLESAPVIDSHVDRSSELGVKLLGGLNNKVPKVVPGNVENLEA